MCGYRHLYEPCEEEMPWGEEEHPAIQKVLFLPNVPERWLKAAVRLQKTDVCLSVTGLAGPGGGTEEIPVGTVFMGCCCNGKTVAKEFHFTGNRSRIREQAAAQALTLIRDCVLDQTEENNR